LYAGRALRSRGARAAVVGGNAATQAAFPL